MKSIWAYLYPKKIIIATMIGDKYGSTWTRTDCLSILPVNISNLELGVVAIRHILLSEIREISIDEHWSFRERFKMLTKLKTEGQIAKDTKLVLVILAKDKVTFEPRNNRYSIGRPHSYDYHAIPDSVFSIDYPCITESIGSALRKAWELAIIT